MELWEASEHTIFKDKSGFCTHETRKEYYLKGTFRKKKKEFFKLKKNVTVQIKILNTNFKEIIQKLEQKAKRK